MGTQAGQHPATVQVPVDVQRYAEAIYYTVCMSTWSVTYDSGDSGWPVFIVQVPVDVQWNARHTCTTDVQGPQCIPHWMPGVWANSVLHDLIKNGLSRESEDETDAMAASSSNYCTIEWKFDHRK